MSATKFFTNASGAPVADDTNIMTAGPRGPALLQDIRLIEKLAHFDREVIPERLRITPTPFHNDRLIAGTRGCFAGSLGEIDAAV